MRRVQALLLALAAVALLADGTAAAQEDPDTSPAESSPEPTPEDGGILAVGTRLASGSGVVRIYVDRELDDTYNTRIDEFAPYTADIQGGIRVAMGDFDGDGNDELVTATGGNNPIKVFDLASDGRHGAQLMSFGGFPQGAQVAAGDINGDGRDELVIGSDRGTPKVQVRADSTSSGLPGTVVDTFNAFVQARGVRVALGDTDNATGDELVTSQGPGTVSRVRVWNDTDNDNAFSDNPVVDSFLSFDPAFQGGTSVAVVNPDEAGPTNADQIMVAPESGQKRVRRWADADNDGDFSDDGVVEQFFPYGSTYGAGVRLAGGDADLSGSLQELITVPATPAGARPLRIFDDDGANPNDFGASTQLDSRVIFNNVGQFVAFGKQLNDHYSPHNLPVAIPDAATVNVNLTVPASAGVIRDLDVFLGIAHTFDGDLDVTLTHLPTATSVALFTDVGGTDAGFLITVNDEGGTDIGAADNPNDEAISGNFNPEGAALLSAFDGLDASGTWRLTITDDAGGDTGTLEAWELQLAV